MQHVELAIVGGGPAGLAAAIEAAQRGIEAVVLERREGVLDKACGEGLMPAALRSLDALGVETPAGRPFLGVVYRDSVDENLVAQGTFPGGAGLGVRRLALHQSLLKRANSAGCDIVTQRATSFEPTKSEVVINGDLSAQWVIAADGLHSRVRREMGLEIASQKGKRYGIRQHFAIAPWTDRVEVHWSGAGEAYVTPVADDLVGVAFLFTPPGRFDDLLAHFPVLESRLEGAQAVTDSLGAGAFARRASRVREGRVLLVGDAAGYEDALTGEGIAIALESARAAVAAIAQGRPERYPVEYAASTWRWRWATRGLLAMTRPRWVHRPLIRALRAWPTLFDRSLGVLGG